MKKIIIISLAVLLLLGTVIPVSASTTDKEIKKTTQSLKDLEKQKEEAQNKVDDLKDKSNVLQGNLSDLNQKLSDTSDQITELETKIAAKQAEIVQTKADLDVATKTKDAQYQSMKVRIRYMYEKGTDNALAVLLSSKSISDFLNKAEYIEAISTYDRNMLEAYKQNCAQISQKEADLETENQQLLAMNDDMQAKKKQIDSLIVSVQSNIKSNQSALSDSQEDVNSYEAKIKEMKAYEEKLEAKKIEEAKKNAEKAKAQEAANAAASASGGSVEASSSDAQLLAALVECEAGGESYDGQLAVASVVVNRVRSGSFPNSVSGVIYQGGQFSPAASGRLALVLSRGAQASSVQAANAALSGQTNVTALYFCRNNGEISGTVIGNHVFY